MLLAGLCLDMDILKQLFGIIMSVTILPSICEVAIITIIAKYLLLMPWLWGLALGYCVRLISQSIMKFESHQNLILLHTISIPL